MVIICKILFISYCIIISLGNMSSNLVLFRFSINLLTVGLSLKKEVNSLCINL